MKQQFAPRPPHGQQRMQNIQIALHTQRTWLVSIVISLVLLLLIASILFVINQFFLPTSLLSLLFTISGVLLSLSVFLVVFLLVLLGAILTAKRRAITAYRNAVRRNLEQSLRSYYPPENAPDLSQEQEQHLLLLGLPGSGKTKTLENFLYQAVTHLSLRTDKWIPVLIQMKYYNGFLRQHPPDALADTQAAKPTETLLAYLLDDKHQQSAQATKEPELPGIQHLHFYLRQFIEQGCIVFLCDGMNELESDALQTVHNELIDLMQTHNRVIMTCRELEYQEQPLLHDFTDQGATPKTLPALSEGDVPHLVERYLQSQAALLKGKRRRAAISEIPQTQNLILRINRPHRYTSPFMLIRLIQAVRQLGEGQAQTISRGRLLRTSVDQNLIGKDAQAVRRFLSVIAYTARRTEQRNAIQLGSNRRPTSLTGFAENLNDWLKKEVDDTIYTASDIRKFLVIAENVGLVTISHYGTLSFIHELIAEYFAAEYLSYIYHEKRNSETFWANLYESEANAPGIWSEPVALWAGLEEEPMDVATFLLQWAEHYNRQRDENDKLYYHALALSLTCVGVKPPDPFPPIIWRYLRKFVRGTEERAKLAKILKRCADEGGIEVYTALLPLTDTEGLPDLFLELHELHSNSDDNTISTLLFGYLEKVATGDEHQIPELVGVLGTLGKRKFGDQVRSRARSLLGEAANPIPLRVAAIGILGLIKDAGDVQLLINCLHDPNNEITGTAIGTLITFGPELALTAIMEEERNLRGPAHAPTRLNLCLVLQEFLKEEQPPQYYQRIIGTTIQFLSSFDNVTTHQDARKLLHEQMQKNEQCASIVTNYLLRFIATTDEQQAKRIQRLLQDNCLAVLPNIIEYWKTQNPSEQARRRIIEILGEVRDRPEVSDKPILTFLLQQLDESVVSVQQALCHALSLHQPESIHPLVLIMLTSNTSDNANGLAVKTLKEIGDGSIAPICRELLNIQSHPHAPERGLRSLVESLHYFRENALTPGNINERVVRTLIVLLTWLTDNVRYVPLTAYVIQVMVGFRHSLVVRPLIQLLGRSEAALDKVYEQAIKGLSSLGDIAFNDLIDALNSPQETLTTQRVRLVLRGISPFPYDSLLSQFKDSRGTVVRQVRQVFIENQHTPQTAPFLVDHLLDDKDISDNVKETIKAMRPDITMPPLVKALSRFGWQDVLELLLLGCPEPTTVIRLQVDELGDAQRRGPAGDILLKFLLKFGPSLVLPLLLPGLQDANARAYTRRLIVQMVDAYQQRHMDLLPHIVNLFEPADTRPEARRVLRELLTDELAHLSLPALINSLGKQPLIEDCTRTLMILVDLPVRQDEVLQKVLQALRDSQKRQGAHVTLVSFGKLACGKLAAERVCSLLTDNNKTMTEEARSILAEMGETAFPSIYKLAHDPQHISDAKDIFMRMAGPLAANGLLRLLVSNDIQDLEMAFSLLHMRIDHEYRSSNFEMTIAMLRQAQEEPNSDVRLRILTALLFFNNSTQTQQREKIAEHIVHAIKSSPKYHTEFMRTLLLLGTQAVKPLVSVIDTTTDKVQLEAIGTLGALVAHPRIIGYVEALARSEKGTGTVNATVQDRGFRALGGLLASGIYNTKELTNLGNNSRGNGDLTSFEFYDVLLSQRNMPAIETLTRERDAARQDAKNQQLQKEQAQSKLAMEQQNVHNLQSKLAMEQQNVRNLQSKLATEQQNVRKLESQVELLKRLVPPTR